MRTIHLKLIPGDGIGVEVVREGKRVLERIAESGNRKYLPALKRWSNKASRRIRRHIRDAMRVLTR